MRLTLVLASLSGVLGAGSLTPGEPIASPGLKASPSPKKPTLTCQPNFKREASSKKKAVVLDETEACVPPKCVGSWCDECRHHTCGYPEHINCTTYPNEPARGQCHVLSTGATCAEKATQYKAHIAAKTSVLSKWEDGYPYCVHNICLDEGCGICKSPQTNLLKEPKQPMAMCAEKKDTFSFSDASSDSSSENPCIPKECVGKACYTCPCVPPTCIPEPGEDPGYDGASTCYECEFGSPPSSP